VQICVLSYYPPALVAESAVQQELIALGHYAATLAHHGHQVVWLCAQDMLRWCDRALVAETAASLPPTCRYVVPCHPYRLAGVQGLAVADAVWQQPDLHTRLFTLLCLLHRVYHWEVVHVWGASAAMYLGVYTARFLGLPAVASYGAASLWHDTQPSFMTIWTRQYASVGLVATEAVRCCLASLPGGAPLQVLDTTLPEAGALATRLYASLQADSRR
jgi:hypothetical protein